MKILAVDDDIDIGEILGLIAEQAGFPDITVRLSGKSALEIIAEADWQFDCFLLDINMPEMNGIELCRRIRSNEIYRNTPIIMLTALNDKRSVDQAFQAGATDYVTKPFELLDLKARLNVAQQMSILQCELSAMRGELTGTPRGEVAILPGLIDELEIDGFDNLIRVSALKNYLTQRSSAASAATQVFAVKVDGIVNIHTRSSSAEFQYAVTEAAEAISYCFMPFGHMFSYSGNGVFLVVSGGFTFEPGTWMESEIQACLDDKNTQYDSGAPMDIEVSVGNPLQPSAGKMDRAQATFDRAIARAEHKSQIKLTKGATFPIRSLK